MKIYIDISIFVRQERSLGQAFGNIELPCIPSVGASISFSSPAADTVPFVCDGFSGALEVTNVQLVANSGSDNVVVSLEDLVLNSESDGKAVMEYLRTGFALFVDET